MAQLFQSCVESVGLAFGRMLRLCIAPEPAASRGTEDR